MVLGQRQEHVPERHVAAERDAHADQPPDHRARGCRRYPTSPISQNGNGPSRSQVASGPSPWATDTAKAARITPPPSAANAATMTRMPPLWE